MRKRKASKRSTKRPAKRVKKQPAKGGNTEIVAKRVTTTTVEVRFSDPDMARIVGISMNASRYIPTAIKATLEARGLYDDVVQTIYMACIEYWRKNKFNRFGQGKGGEKARYKAIVRHTWRTLYRALRDSVPEYKRPYYDKFMDPEKFKGIADQGPFGIPFSLERDLMKVAEES